MKFFNERIKFDRDLAMGGLFLAGTAASVYDTRDPQETEALGVVTNQVLGMASTAIKAKQEAVTAYIALHKEVNKKQEEVEGLNEQSDALEAAYKVVNEAFKRKRVEKDDRVAEKASFIEMIKTLSGARSGTYKRLERLEAENTVRMRLQWCREIFFGWISVTKISEKGKRKRTARNFIEN